MSDERQQQALARGPGATPTVRVRPGRDGRHFLRVLIAPGAFKESLTADAAAAASELLAKDLTRYRPFRLVAVDATAVVDLRWDRHRLIETSRRLAPACFVSSGLGDHVVEPRLMLFDSIFSARSATSEMQDGFHQHVWPNHEHLSVMMNRELARTTSVTTVETRRTRSGETSVSMRHRDDDGVGDEVGTIVE